MRVQDKFLQFLGLTRRAGAMLAGEYPCLQGLRSGRGHLLVVADDASANTADRLLQAAMTHHCPWIRRYSKDELGMAVGHSQRAALLITDEGMAGRLLELVGRV